MQDLKKVGGEELAEWGRRGGEKDLVLVDMLDLTREQQNTIREYKKQSRATQKKAQQNISRPKDLGDKEAVRRYRMKIKLAMRDYAQKIQKARRAYAEQLQESLSGK